MKLRRAEEEWKHLKYFKAFKDRKQIFYIYLEAAVIIVLFTCVCEIIRSCPCSLLKTLDTTVVRL